MQRNTQTWSWFSLVKMWQLFVCDVFRTATNALAQYVMIPLGDFPRPYLANMCRFPPLLTQLGIRKTILIHF